MTRGIWRPRNKQLVSSNDENEVEIASKEAFVLVKDGSEKNIKKAMGILSKLKGVGPATSSALLACYCPTVIPFMSDEALKCTNLPLSYTQKNYMEFQKKIKDKWDSLDNSEGITINDLQQALWSYTYCKQGNIIDDESKETKTVDSSSTKSSKKRQRTTADKNPRKKQKTEK